MFYIASPSILISKVDAISYHNYTRQPISDWLYHEYSKFTREILHKVEDFPFIFGFLEVIEQVARVYGALLSCRLTVL